jgi:hypothetical protein
MFLLLPLLTATTVLASRTTGLNARAPCTVTSHDDPLTDDAPLIAAALQECGQTNTILLPANQTFTIRSPIDLSPCRACTVQIDGNITIPPDFDYWGKQRSVFSVRNASNVVISAEGGTIDAQGFGWAGDMSTWARLPKLFYIGEESYQVHVRGLRVLNVPSAAFYVSGGSEAVRFYGVEVSTGDVAGRGVEVEDARHVYVWDSRIEAAVACVLMNPDSENVQVQDVTCTALRDGPGDDAPSGVEIGFGEQTGEDVVRWVRNVIVERFRAVGRMNVIAVRNRGEDGQSGGMLELRNATFTDILIERPMRAREAFHLDQGNAGINATEVTLSWASGNVEKLERPVKCAREDDVCGFEFGIGWDVMTPC